MTVQRTYTADQLEEWDLPYPSKGGVFIEERYDNEHRWYVVWRVVFRDPTDGTTWSILRANDKTEMGEVPWWYRYDNRDTITAVRVEPREVTRTEWFEVEDAS